MATKSSSIEMSETLQCSTSYPVPINVVSDDIKSLTQALKFIESSTSEAEYEVVRVENDFAIVDIANSDQPYANHLAADVDVDSKQISKGFHMDEPDLSSIIATLTTFDSDCKVNDLKPPVESSLSSFDDMLSTDFPQIQLLGINPDSELATSVRISSSQQGFLRSLYNIPPPSRMHIVLLVVGTWGDVKPFIFMGQKLLALGQRVRLATHACFRTMVRAQGLEFYPLAGDPLKLSEFMVKNQGFIVPSSSDGLREVPQHLTMLSEIVNSCWDACVSNDDPLEVNDELHPFRANAIISNPVAYGHMHCAEALNIPLHLMFPQPWVGTLFSAVTYIIHILYSLVSQ